MKGTLQKLLDTLPQVGKVEWIGIRPARKVSMSSVTEVQATRAQGLNGDRYAGSSGNRHVTLIQAEHLPVVASCLGQESISPELLRRNIVVSGINLLALKDKDIQIGSVVLRVTGLCHPCSRMETQLGPGGYNALRGHGGITAKVLTDGSIKLGDGVRMETAATS